MSETLFREAVIDAAAIANNVRRLREIAGTPEFIAVVKADGYGHGALTAARAVLAGGATRIGVAELPEALALREEGIDAPLIAWLHDPEERFAEAIAAGIEIGVSRVEQLRRIAEAGERLRSPGEGGEGQESADGPPRVHLKLETGLGRGGIAPGDWAEAFAVAARAERGGLLRVEGVFSHLSGASDEDDLEQARRFRQGLTAASAAGITPRICHLAATAAAIRLPETRFDAVRVGVGVYGLSPFDDATSADLGLIPAMTLRGRVAAVRRVPAGQGVSYGYDYRAERETTLALVPLGYADGVPRQASDAGPVAIRGERHRVAGRVAMDQFVVDVGDVPVEVGDEAVLFGDPATGAPAVEEWADAAGTINYEIVTRIGKRVQRTVRT